MAGMPVEARKRHVDRCRDRAQSPDQIGSPFSHGAGLSHGSSPGFGRTAAPAKDLKATIEFRTRFPPCGFRHAPARGASQEISDVLSKLTLRPG